MILRLVFLSIMVALGTAVVGPAGHYVPQSGDSFHYNEVVSLNNGYGSYQGYTENTTYTGNLSVTAVAADGTESAYYEYTYQYENNSGGSSSGTQSGPFTFSAVTFHYVQGTDGQVGYTNPYVWFYMNNSLPVGAGFYVLNTGMIVVSKAYDYHLGTAAGAYVTTIFAEGNGSYQRDDSYGVFSAQYNWKEYFDPATGYVVGYTYTEQDSNTTANSGFTWTDTLEVTSTTYPLTAGTAPATGSSSSSSSLSWTLVIAVIVVLVIVVVIVAWALRARRRHPLPEHSARGQVQYTAPMAPPPLGPPPPPISLTPSGQPAVQQIIIKETVKVNCRYCGSLIDSTAEKCPFCGATRT
jgi:hypothetical protein